MMTTRSQLILMVALLTLSGSAFASKAGKAVSQCRDAVSQEQGEDAVTKLKKVKSRGVGYDIWLNVKDGDTELRSFCYLKRGELQQIVTEEGRWTSTHPKRPSAETADMRTAMTTSQ